LSDKNNMKVRARALMTGEEYKRYNNDKASGPPSRPLEFPAPFIGRAKWKRVKIAPFRNGCTKGNHMLPTTVHILYSSRGMSRGSLTDKAYWVKKKISDTVYGCIRVCVVMVRQKREKTNKEPDKIESDLDSLWEPTGELVAVKMSAWKKIRSLRGRHLEDPLKEISGMQLVGNYHPHILGCIEAMQDEEWLYLVTPLCRGGDLFGKVLEGMRYDGRGMIEESLAKIWFRQVLLGLLHLQKKGVCHRDICLENILIHDGKCKIIDMGLCLRVPYFDPNNEGCVADVSADTNRLLMINQGQGGRNLLYLAPELIAEDTFDGFATDLWSAAIILYIMLTGHAPFKWAHESDVNFNRLINGELKSMMEQCNIPISDEACDLLQKMLHRDPQKRMTLCQVMTHTWVVALEETNDSYTDSYDCKEQYDTHWLSGNRAQI